jgi:methylated-DNA-protein-cysteine methyltransferase-like protein
MKPFRQDKNLEPNESGFRESVLKIVARIPKGNVISYGQAAMMAGFPRAARQVGWVLHTLPNGTMVPWHRVLSANGHVPSKGRELAAMEQIARLRREGVEVADDGTLDIEFFRWHGGSGQYVSN